MKNYALQFEMVLELLERKSLPRGRYYKVCASNESMSLIGKRPKGWMLMSIVRSDEDFEVV